MDRFQSETYSAVNVTRYFREHGELPTSSNVEYDAAPARWESKCRDCNSVLRTHSIMNLPTVCIACGGRNLSNGLTAETAQEIGYDQAVIADRREEGETSMPVAATAKKPVRMQGELFSEVA